MIARRQLKRQAVKERLMAAALDLFREKGVKTATIDEVVGRADTAKGTFFNYFETKEHVLVEYYEQLSDKAFADAGRIMRHGSAERRTLAILRCFARTLDDDIELARSLLSAVFSSSLVAATDRQTEDEMHKLLRSVLEEGIAKGELRADLEIDVFCSLLTAALSSSIQDWVRDARGHNIDKALKQKIALLFRAAHSAKSR